MKEIAITLFRSDLGNDWNNAAWLIFRLLLALELFRVHGMKKFRVKNGQREQVPNPLNLPPKLNFIVATFSDTVVPFLIMGGIATRLVILPTIGVTTIGYFIVHRKDDLEVRDVPYMYTLCLLCVLALGAGTYSIDHLIYSFLK